MVKYMQREDIYIISRFSNLTEERVATTLQECVYNDKYAWQKFLRLFLVSLGVGFTVSGIIFFFAYNWADLHKFTKIGLTELVLITATILALVPKINDNIKNVILMGASILVGVLFAVFGQIYQTGANAYDFFLAWTIFVTLWVLVSYFAPLWLLYLVLINTTLVLYSQQVAKDWSEVFICTILFAVNTTILISANLLVKSKVPNWLKNIIAVAATSYATIGIVIGMFNKYQASFPVLIVVTALVFAFGIWHGFKTKSGFYLSVIPFSLIIIVSALLIKISDGEMIFLIVSLFIIGSVTLTIKNLINLQKKNTNEN